MGAAGFKDKHPALPACLMEASKGLALSDEELHGLWTRLGFIDEIEGAIEAFLSGDEQGECLRSFFDDMELHLGLALGLKGDSNNSYSWWRAHSTWGFAGNPSIASFSLPIRFRMYIASPLPEISDLDMLSDWLRTIALVFRDLIEYLFACDRFSEAFASIVAIDSAVAFTLAGISRQRLSEHFSSLLNQ